MERLLVAAELGRVASSCGSPHVAFDVLHAIERTGRRARCLRVSDTTRLDATYAVDDKIIVMRQTDSSARDTHVAVSRDNRVVFATPMRVALVRTRVVDVQGGEHDLAPILYKHWGATFAALSGRDRLHEAVEAHTGVAAAEWILSEISYMDASVVASAVAMLVDEPYSEA